MLAAKLEKVRDEGDMAKLLRLTLLIFDFC
jgi:hypothetical protein